MHYCYLCQLPRESYTNYFCSNCHRISTIIAAYSAPDCLHILESVCLRNKKQINTKISQQTSQQKDGGLAKRHKGVKGLDGDQ